MPSAKCGGCAKFLSPLEAARCCTCNALFHRACAFLPPSGYINPTWVCPNCKNISVKGKAVAAPAEACVLEESMDTSGLSCSTLGDNQDIAPGLSDILRSFKEELRAELRQMFKEELRAELQAMQKQFKCEFQSLRTDLAQLQADRDLMKGTIEQYGKRVDGMDSRMDGLEQRITATNGSGATEEIAQLKRELNDRDQQLLSNDLEISNLPELISENLTHTVKLIATKLGVKIDDRDIVSVDRMGGRQVNVASAAGPVETRPRTVVVRLVRRDLRDELMRAARVRRGATTADLEMSGPSTRYYLNERLTKVNRLLFRRAREAGQRLGWQFVWTKHGRILARRKPGDKAKLIRNETDLLEVFGPDGEKLPQN